MNWTDTKYESIRALMVAYRNGRRPRLAFAKHFIDRMQAMKVTEDEVFAAIANPEELHYSPKYEACYLQHGRITISVQLDPAGFPDANTLLWRYQEDWIDAANSGVMGGSGRALRDDLSHLPSRAS